MEGVQSIDPDELLDRATRAARRRTPDAELRGLAEQAAARIGLPLEVVVTGDAGLEAALATLLAPTAAQQ